MRNKKRAEIERIHVDDDDVEVSVCADPNCPRTHLYGIYVRSIDSAGNGYGRAEWIADFDSRNEAIGAAERAFGVNVLLMPSMDVL